MKDRSFSLEPFHPVIDPTDLRLTGNISSNANIIAIDYEIRGGFSDIVIPPSAEIPARKDALWEETCFEFFIGVKNADQYWEFNLSPAGHWNVYHFTAYREGMEEEPVFSSLPFCVLNNGDSLSLSLEIDLGTIVTAGQALTAGISAVVKARDGAVSYWALIHPGPEPDFHLRESFIIEV